MRVVTCALLLLCVVPMARAEDKRYAVTRTLEIGGDGGWDYVSVDPSSHRLYVTRGSHTMVIKADSGKVAADIPVARSCHGVALVPDIGRGFITDGSGAIIIFDLKTNNVLGRIDAPEDADGIIYDEASKHVLCASGDGNSLTPIAPDVDPKSGKADPPIELGGGPEFLSADGKGKVFVALKDKDEVAVIDTKVMKLVARYPVKPGGSPVGMSMDRAHGRLFIGCRKPPKMIVMEASSGKVLADLPIGEGVDATQFDGGDAFASCRDGTLAVVRETSPGKFEVVQTVETKPGARTMGLDPSTHTLYLPTAEYESTSGQGRPKPKAGSFMILVVEPK